MLSIYKKTVGLFVAVICILSADLSFGQVTCNGINPGQIFQPATTSVMDLAPKDGWVTLAPNFVPPARCGFNTSVSNYNCINQFEFAMYGVPEIGTGDVLNDNVGASCGITDLIPDARGYSVYTIRRPSPTDATKSNLIFRFRLGNFNSSVEAYSILIDTDQRFGKVGDANVSASTADPNWTSGNPGFELEVTLVNNSNGNSGGVFVYDIDGIDSCPTPIASYGYNSHVQISQADSQTCNDPDYFFDYYVPLDSVVSRFNANKANVSPARAYDLKVTTALRYAALTNQNAGCAMQGKISDISGVDNSDPKYSTQSATGIYNSFLAVVTSQCGTPLDDLVPGAGGFDKDVTHAPTINGPLNVGQTVVTGSTCSPTTGICEPGIYIRIDVYHALTFPPQALSWTHTPVDPTTTPPAGKVTEGATETTWSITLNAPLLAYDSVVATTQRSESIFASCIGNGGNTSSSSTAVVVKCLLEATLTPTNVSCFGGADGTITSAPLAFPNNGTPPYTYSWNTSPVQTTSTASNLPPGTYSLVFKDSKGCQAIINPVTITQPTALTATRTFTNVTCNSANDGTITISSPSGGYGTYQYSINGGTSWQSSGSFTGLANGTYNVLIRDAAHTSCVVDLDGSGNTVITQPAVLNATVASANLNCNGANDGTITITSPTGGYGTYEYSINGGTSWQSSGSFTGLSIGTYIVLMRDAAHISCTKNLGGSSNITLTQPSALSATVASSNITCNGANDGTITITSPSGGYGTYQYSINGGTSWQSSGSFTGLPGGTYNVMIRDAAHTSCSATDLDGSGNTTITQPGILSATVSATNVTCNGANDGTITITSPSGGSGSYQFSINGGISWQSSGSFTGLTNTSYDVRIRDAAHTACVIDLDGSSNTSITQPGVLNATLLSGNISCNGASDGTITVSSPSGGSGSYQYSINGGVNWQSSGSFTGLANGTYNVLIRDAAHTSCLLDLDGGSNTTLTQPAALNATVASTNVNCSGASDGTITITSPTGGYGTYEYSINGGTGWQSSGSFTGLANGTYTVLIRDAAHTSCVKNLGGSSNISITQPSALSATVASTNITCNGANDGTITISSPSGGYGTFEYSINGGSSWQSSGSFTGLSSGTYSVMIRDAAHTSCSIDLDGSGNTTITQPGVLSATVASTNVTCNGASDGTITLTSPAGGSGSYQYSINGGTSWQSSGSFTGLANASYDVRIRDAANTSCTVDLDGGGNTTITQPAVLNATLSSGNISCSGLSDGTITITSPTGGYGTYEYSINGGTSWQSSGSFTGLANGTYNVLIRDAAHTSCLVDLDGGGNTTITQPAALNATVASTNVTCNGGTDGSITISSPTGGYGTYEYSINGGTGWQSSGSFTGISSGSYNVLIRDAAHTSCTVDLDGSSNTTISQPTALSATISSTSNVTCNGASDGSITITSPSGGSGSYEYSINGGSSWQSSGSFTGLANNTYNVLIRDAAHTSCTVDLDASVNTTITQPGVLNATISSTNISCNGASDGSITLSSPSGGSGSYQYSINGGINWQSSGSFTGLGNGTYNVLIRDAAHNSCSVDLDGGGNTTITQPTALSATVTPTNVTTTGAGDGKITITSPTGGYGTYEYSINGGSTWQSSGSYTGLSNGTYNVFIRDAAHIACVVNLGNISITQPNNLNANVTVTNITCNSVNDGTITISSATGGSGSFEYSIDGGGSWLSSGSFTGLSNTPTYNVHVRDANDHSLDVDLDGSINTTITRPAILAATLTFTNVTCNGSSDGIITISNPTGGYGTYEYSRNGGSTWQSSGSFTGLSNATYNVMIRDAAHTSCIVDLDGGSNTTISQPVVLSASLTSSNVTCNGVSNGSITVSSPAGGAGTYEYSINGGTNWQSSGSFTGLANNTYNVLIRDAAHTSCSIDLDGGGNTVVTQPAVLNATLASNNISCNGANDGSITLTSPTGGSGSYQYSINGGASWLSSGSFTGLSNSTYNVLIRDANNTSCSIDKDGSANTVITQPAVLNATLSSSNMSCNGTSDGTITITSPAGGYGTYEYSINGGSSWLSSGLFTGLASSTHNVLIRDAAHASCVVDLDGAGNTTNITQPTVLSASVASTNINCNGANNGTITVSSPAGGYGTYQYSINGGTSWQSSGSFINLTNGTYNVIVRDAAHTACTIDLDGSGNTNITQLAALTATLTSTNISCNGTNDASITISSASGGSGTFGYSINGGTSWQSTGSFSNLSSGSYNVLIRDASNTSCIIDLDGSVSTTPLTQPATLTATLASTNISCNGANDGQITLTAPTGGYGTFEYSINNGSSWQSSGAFTGLSAGPYNVLIRDAAHTACSIDLDGSNNTSITQPNVVSATLASTNATCNGGSNGSITVSSPTGGYGTYQYSINGGTSWLSSGAFANVASGVYNVMIRDAAHTTCTIDLDGSGNTNITQPTAMNASVAVTNVTSFGASDGTIKITSLGGGSGTYEYSINAGANWFSSGNFTGLNGGTYNVQIRDASNTSCVVDLDGSLNTSLQQPGAPLSASLTSTNISCNGNSDGSITITSPAGGYGTYEYSINGGTTWQSSGTFTGLASGTYNVQMRDAAYPSDVIDLDGTINTSMNQPGALSASVTSTNVTCPGANDGSISITSPTGGSGTYQYSINGGTTWSASGTFTALVNGNYNLAMRDAAHPGCVIDLDGVSNSTAITQPIALSATVAVTNVSSPGATDGAITVSSPSGGYGGYEYSIDGGATWQSSGSFTGLGVGNYNVLMRDASHTSCSTDLDGSGSTTPITQPAVLNGTVLHQNVTCNGVSDGNINITSPSGGYGSYEFSVNGGTNWQSSGTFNGLPNGTYNVMMRDATHPTNSIDLDGSGNTNLTQPAALSATISSSNVTTTGANDGAINISSPAGGYGTYEYSINGGTSWQSSGVFSGLANGTYSVAIRDAAHTACAIDLDGSTNTVILPPLNIYISSLSDVSCFGVNTGTVTATANYGVTPYKYSLDGVTFTTSNTFSGLAPGNYTVWVKDANGKTATTTATVGQPNAALSALVANQKDALCFGSNSGTITANGVNGTAPYTYSRDGATFLISNSFTGLVAGSYTITVRDANGCVATTTSVIAQPTEVIANTTSVTINGMDNGSVAAVVRGGTPPYSFAWTGPNSFFAATDTISQLVPGVYTLVVTDANSCNAIAVSYTLTFRIYQGISPNNDGKNDYWRIDGIEGYPNNKIRIFDRFNNLVYETIGYSNESNNWYGQSNHGLVRDALPEGTYFYAVDLGDGSGLKSGYVILKRH